MNLIQLEYFQAVCTYQSISAAAEYLHISQPSLSVAIKELEREYGVVLFKRQHRGMKLTAEGEQLFAMSSSLLKQFRDMEQKLYALGNKRKLLQLGVPPMIGSLLLPQIYSEFAKQHPDVRLEITEGGRKELLSQLLQDTLDMVFLPHVLPFEDTLKAVEITQFEVVCGMAKANPLSMRGSLSMSDLEGIPLALFKNSFFQTEEIKKRFSLENVEPDILLQTAQLSTVESMIENNAAVGFLFKPLIENNGAIASVSLEPPLYVKVSLVWKKAAYLCDSMRAFCRFAESFDA